MAERKVNLERFTDLKREFQSSESIYIKLIDRLDVTYAESLGFIKAEPDAFLSRQKAMAQYNNYGQTFR
jgi:hypothetical protein